MTPLEKELCEALQNDMLVSARPFRDLATRIGRDEGFVIAKILELMQSGVIRKLGAIIHHQKVGYKKNAMIVWSVPHAYREKAGAALASFDEVTHCYERTPPFLEQYSLFTMVHFKDGEEDKLLSEMTKAAGTDKFLILSSDQEFKKSSMVYRFRRSQQ